MLKDGSVINTKELAAKYLAGQAMPAILDEAQCLVGKTVARVGYIVLGGAPYPYIKFSDGTYIVVNCDDEGNGPGAVEIVKGESSVGLCQTSLV